MYMGLIKQAICYLWVCSFRIGLYIPHWSIPQMTIIETFHVDNRSWSDNQSSVVTLSNSTIPVPKQNGRSHRGFVIVNLIQTGAFRFWSIPNAPTASSSQGSLHFVFTYNQVKVLRF